MNDERSFYAMVASDMMKDAWKRYISSVEATIVVLRNHGFTEE
jgi:hypothetical protein